MNLSNCEDMKNEPLPKGIEDTDLPTQVYLIDEKIKSKQKEIELLTTDINDLLIDRRLKLSRAKELNITTDSQYKIIEEPIYPKKKVDVDALKRLDPVRYQQILTNIKMKLQDKIAAETEKAETYIAQVDVKAVIKDKAMLAMVIPEPKEPSGWNVVVVKR